MLHTHTHTQNFSLKNGMREQVFTCKSAKANITWPHPMVAAVTYSGVICDSFLREMRNKVIVATLSARVLVLDYSKVLFAMREFTHPTIMDGVTDAPAIIIVSPAYYEFTLAHADAMASIGIMRDVALPWQTEKVLEFVETLTGIRAHREFQKTLETLSSEHRLLLAADQTAWRSMLPTD